MIRWLNAQMKEEFHSERLSSKERKSHFLFVKGREVAVAYFVILLCLVVLSISGLPVSTLTVWLGLLRSSIYIWIGVDLFMRREGAFIRSVLYFLAAITICSLLFLLKLYSVLTLVELMLAVLATVWLPLSLPLSAYLLRRYPTVRRGARGPLAVAMLWVQGLCWRHKSVYQPLGPAHDPVDGKMMRPTFLVLSALLAVGCMLLLALELMAASIGGDHRTIIAVYWSVLSLTTLALFVMLLVDGAMYIRWAVNFLIWIALLNGIFFAMSSIFAMSRSTIPNWRYSLDLLGVLYPWDPDIVDGETAAFHFLFALIALTAALFIENCSGFHRRVLGIEKSYPSFLFFDGVENSSAGIERSS